MKQTARPSDRRRRTWATPNSQRTGAWLLAALLSVAGAQALADDARPADEANVSEDISVAAASTVQPAAETPVAPVTVVQDAVSQDTVDQETAQQAAVSEDAVTENPAGQALGATPAATTAAAIEQATTGEPEAAAMPVSAEIASSPDLPVAPNVDLKAPQPDGIDTPAEDSTKEAQPAPEGRSIVLLGTEVEPGTSTRLAWSAQEAFDGIAASTPVLVVNGARPGPVLCVTAAVHGDELNGIEMVRRTFYDIEPKRLAGTLIGVPIVNLDGFRRNSRYLSDRRDLNRYFPGNPRGSSASRIAYSFFNQVILQCEALVDLHTGSFHRTNLPQLRANLKNDAVRKFVDGFGNMVVLHSVGAKGTLRRAATNRGIPAVTLEAGEPLRLQKKAVSQGVRGLRHLLSHMGMYGKRNTRVEREPHYYKSHWIRADQGGILFSEVSLGDRVRPGKVLGTITDPITNVQSKLVSEHQGRVLGMALNQVLMPGFAAFRIGISTTEEEVKSADAKPRQPTGAPTSLAVASEPPIARAVGTAQPQQQPAEPAASAATAALADSDSAADTDGLTGVKDAEPATTIPTEVVQDTGKIRGEDAPGSDPAATYEPPPNDHPAEASLVAEELLADAPVAPAAPAQADAEALIDPSHEQQQPETEVAEEE
ncbi:MAG: succinylglutamate desuccinylase/aspartoacylase family protein [Pseudomonadota bacterium]